MYQNNAAKNEISRNPTSEFQKYSAANLKSEANVNNGPFGVEQLKNPLTTKQRSWVDPLEPAIQDTFYDRQLNKSRPDFASVETINKSEVELHDLFDGESAKTDAPPKHNDDESSVVTTAATGGGKGKKFGAWDGVFTGCILNIFGVIMFLRVGWVVGQAGVWGAIAIISISSLVTFLTTLSMSAICTNGTILSGGAYYIISRALGPAIGGSVGLMFSIGNMVAVSLYLIGFAETLVQNIGTPILTGDAINDVRIWSNIVLSFELVLAIVGLKYVVKANQGLLVLIFLTIACFFIGSFYRTANNDQGEQVVFGAEGFSNGNLENNFAGVYVDGYNFWGVLAIFFPAVTGIMAGANISGDLRNPSEDIPLGTLVAVVSSTITYCTMAFFVGAVAKRSELLTNYVVMADIAVWDGLVLMGIYAATLSSGIAALVGAPRILQAVASDQVIDVPILNFFAKTDDEGNPIRGYFLSFAVAAGCNCIGELNFVAPLISQFFMIAYLMINFSCFAMELSKSPNWRPSFKYYNKWCALTGFLLCLTIMFLVELYYAIVTIIIGLGIWVYIYIKDPNVEWGSAQNSRSYYRINQSLLRLRNIKMHVKNWRPQVLCLIKKLPFSFDSDIAAYTAADNKDLNYVYFAQTLKASYGSVFFGTVIVRDDNNIDNVSKFCEKCRQIETDGYLPRYLKQCSGFYETVFCETFRRGACNLFQLCGIGSLRPNTVMIGFLNKWQEKDEQEINEYVDLLRNALTLRMGLVILTEGFETKINWSTVIQGTMDKSEKLNTNEDNPFIDVWWMLDDGGFTMLLPHLMKQDPFWKDCKLRMNLVVNKNDMLQSGFTDNVVVEGLMAKFRLSFEPKVRAIYVDDNKPQQSTIDKYENLLSKENIKIDDLPRPEVIRRWLKLSELMFQYSGASKAVVVTLPLPNQTLNSKAYVALLHCLSNQTHMPPMIIMRGNGSSSLTFYSD